MIRWLTARRREAVKAAVAVGAAVAVAAAALAWTAVSPPPSGAAATVTLDADAYTDFRRGFDNFGSARQLSVDIGKNAFLRFTVSGTAGPVRKATLRLHVADNWAAGSDQGGSVKGVSNTTWSESLIRYFWGQPPIDGATFGTIGPVTANNWYEVDVTAAVGGNGTYSFAVTSPSADTVIYDSRETGGATAPVLVVDSGSTTTSSSSTSTSSTSSTSTSSTSSTSTSSTSTSTTSSTVPPGADPILVGAGDIAVCPGGQQGATASAITNIINGNPQSPVTVFNAGDNAYQTGTLSEYNNCYGPTWGAFKNRTRPSPGNHEYFSGANGYFDYFGTSAGERGRGYYSYDIGSNWHVVSLNGNCNSIGGCAAGSAQYQWLVQDLQNSTRPCTAVYVHQAYFTSSSTHPQDGAPLRPLIDAMYADGVEIFVQGHEHQYERFAPQTPARVADPTRGIQAFVVGTGGTTSFYGMGPAQPNSQSRITNTNGVIKFNLHANSYDFSFVTAPGGTTPDSGSGTCH